MAGDAEAPVRCSIPFSVFFMLEADVVTCFRSMVCDSSIRFSSFFKPNLKNKAFFFSAFAVKQTRKR